MFGQSTNSGPTKTARGRPYPSEIFRGRPSSSPENAVDEIMYPSADVWPVNVFRTSAVFDGRLHAGDHVETNGLFRFAFTQILSLCRFAARLRVGKLSVKRYKVEAR